VAPGGSDRDRDALLETCSRELPAPKATRPAPARGDSRWEAPQVRSGGPDRPTSSVSRWPRKAEPGRGAPARVRTRDRGPPGGRRRGAHGRRRRRRSETDPRDPRGRAAERV